MRLSAVEHEIPADYQFRALTNGWAPQRAWHRARLDLVADLLPPSDRTLSLDAAAGSGLVAWRFGASRVVSTDIRFEACRFIQQNTRKPGAVASALEALPFRTGAFHQIYLLEVIEHLESSDALQVLRELRRVCHANGRLLITTPNYASHWGLMERSIDALRLTPRMAGEQHVSRYTAQSLASAATGTGWRIGRAGTFNLLAPLAGMASSAAGAWLLRREVARNWRAGALLYVLCEPAA